MDITSSLVITILCFILLLAIAYFGCLLTLWSAIAISVFISLILLMFLSPISEVTNDSGYAVGVYALIVGLGFILLAVYICIACLSDVRKECKECC